MRATSSADDPNDPQILRWNYEELLRANQQFQRELEQIRHHYQLLVQRIQGRCSEKIGGQGWLDDPAEPATPVVPELKPEAKPVAPTTAGSPWHGWRKLPAGLPLQRVDHDLP